MSIINYYKNKLEDEIKIIDIYSGKKLAERYKHKIDWPRWFAIVENLGPQCNGRKDRFDKADIFEGAISECSNGKLKWVDDIGRDHYDTELNLDIEFKYANKSLYTGKNKPKQMVSFKIKNSLGETTSNKIEYPADYYMFAQENAVGIISYGDLSPYLRKTGDGLDCKIPHGKINYIITPSECNIREGNFKIMNYKERKRQMQLEFINSVPPSKGFH
jgi:hypothetical protein